MAHKSAVVDVLTPTFSALNVSGLTSLLGATGVTNKFPADPTYPYTRLEAPDQGRWDTFGKAGKELLVWVHVFSQAKSDLIADNIVGKVIELLHYVAHTVGNHALARYQYDRDFNGEDELLQGVRTSHRIVQFRVNVQQTS